MAFKLPKLWPYWLPPKSCEFGLSSNDETVVSPRSRIETTMVKGRPLWTCKLTFERIQYRDEHYLDQLVASLNGSRNAIQIWDFTRDLPRGTARGFGGYETKKNEVLLKHGADRFRFFMEGREAFSSFRPRRSIPAGFATPANSYRVHVTGWMPNEYVGRSGDYVQIDNRLYLLASSFKPDSDGSGYLDIMSPLIKDCTPYSRVGFYHAAVEMRASDPSWSQSRSAGEGMSTMSLSFIETSQDFT